MLPPPPREFGHGPQIPVRNPETHMDLPALHLRPHGSRSHAPGLEQVSMQELR